MSFKLNGAILIGQAAWRPFRKNCCLIYCRYRRDNSQHFRVYHKATRSLGLQSALGSLPPVLRSGILNLKAVFLQEESFNDRTIAKSAPTGKVSSGGTTI